MTLLKKTLALANKVIDFCDLGNVINVAVVTKKSIYLWKPRETGECLKRTSLSYFVKDLAYTCMESLNDELYYNTKYAYERLKKNEYLLVVYSFDSDLSSVEFISSDEELETVKGYYNWEMLEDEEEESED